MNLRGLRFWPRARYPHLVFYVERPEHIDVWRVLHGQRDIPAWMQAPDTPLILAKMNCAEAFKLINIFTFTMGSPWTSFDLSDTHDEFMDPLLKRAVIKLNPDYFSLSANEQLQFRLNLSSKQYARLNDFLIENLFGHELVMLEANDELVDGLTDAQTTQLNAMLLPLIGIGDDNFFLNEHFGGGKTLLDFDTLYDYDLQDFEFQQQANKSKDPDYPIQPYRGMLYSAWARLLLDDHFTYATLSMAASYIQGELVEYQNECIQALIPHEYVEGENHGKPDNACYVWDFRRNAHGKEAQLDELISRSMRYIAARYQELLNEYDQAVPGQVYILNCGSQDDPTHHFIFSDKELLKRIHFQAFMNDCRLHEASDLTVLFDKINTEKASLKSYLENQYNDIMANFDPTVVKFKKKRKIMVHKDAGLDDLF